MKEFLLTCLLAAVALLAIDDLFLRLRVELKQREIDYQRQVIRDLTKALLPEPKP